MSMPIQKPGHSKQDYGTPPALLNAIRHRLCISDFSVDLAASDENKICPVYYGEGFNSLRPEANWNFKPGEWAWLNPPFANIEPWVAKATVEARRGAHIAVLVPLSISEWWVEWVEPYAYKVVLNGRIQFVGADQGYPKDCALLFYTPWGFKGSEIWTWKRSVPKLRKSKLSEDKGVPEMLGL